MKKTVILAIVVIVAVFFFCGGAKAESTTETEKQFAVEDGELIVSEVTVETTEKELERFDSSAWPKGVLKRIEKAYSAIEKNAELYVGEDHKRDYVSFLPVIKYRVICVDKYRKYDREKNLWSKIRPERRETPILKDKFLTFFCLIASVFLIIVVFLSVFTYGIEPKRTILYLSSFLFLLLFESYFNFLIEDNWQILFFVVFALPTTYLFLRPVDFYVYDSKIITYMLIFATLFVWAFFEDIMAGYQEKLLFFQYFLFTVAEIIVFSLLVGWLRKWREKAKYKIQANC